MITNPRSIRATAVAGTRGILVIAVGAMGGAAGEVTTASSCRKSQRKASHSTTSTTKKTGAKSRTNPRNPTLRKGSASRLVRLLTGSNSEAELAIRRQANAEGRPGTPRRTAAPTTTGVSSTAVASRLRVVVTSAPRPKALANNNTPACFGPNLSRSPNAANNPVQWQTAVITRIAARNKITGSRRRTASSVASRSTAPTASTAITARAETPASIQRAGCRWAVSNSARRPPRATTSWLLVSPECTCAIYDSSPTRAWDGLGRAGRIGA